MIAFCLEEEFGDVIWKGHKYGTEFYSSHGLENRAFVSESSLLVLNGGRLSIFNKTKGQRMSPRKGSSEMSSLVNVRPEILKRNLNHFSCIDVQTGKSIKEFSSVKKVSGQPILFNNMAYYVTYDGRLNAES